MSDPVSPGSVDMEVLEFEGKNFVIVIALVETVQTVRYRCNGADGGPSWLWVSCGELVGSGDA